MPEAEETTETPTEMPALPAWPVPDDTVSYELAELWSGRPIEIEEDGDGIDSDPRA